MQSTGGESALYFIFPSQMSGDDTFEAALEVLDSMFAAGKQIDSAKMRLEQELTHLREVLPFSM